MSLIKFEDKMMKGVQGATTVVKVPVLEENGKNGEEISAHTEKMFEVNNCLQFLLRSYNVSTTMLRKDEQDELFIYAKQIKEKQAEHLKMKQEEDKKGDEGVEVGELTLTSEELKVLKMVQERRPRYSKGGYGADEPETVASEKLRYQIFDHLSLILEPNHKHHLEGVQQGNLQELHDVIMSLSKKRPMKEYAEKLHAVSGLLTSLAHDFPMIQKTFMAAGGCFTNSDIKVEDLLVPFLLLAFDGDMRYKTAADRMRRQHESDPLPLAAVLGQLSVENKRIQDGEMNKAKANAIKLHAKLARAPKIVGGGGGGGARWWPG